MPHDPHTIRSHFAHVERQPDHTAKKAALFDTIKNMIVASIGEAAALGATDAQLKPFTDTVAHFEAMRHELIAINLS